LEHILGFRALRKSNLFLCLARISCIPGGFGRKVFTVDDMPDIWVDFVRERFPGVVEDPRGALQG
jgi:hypothetical protein